MSAGAGGEAPAGDGAWAGAAPGRRRTGRAPGAAGEPFGGQVHAGRVALVAAAAAAALLLLVGLVTTLVVAVLGPVGATVAAGLHLRRLYQSTPEARAAERADVAWSAPRRAVVDAEQAVEQLARERAALAADEAAAEGTAETARAARRRRDEEELAAVDAALETELAAVAERERLVNRAEQEARAAALAELQLKVIDDQLRHHSVVASGALDDKLVHRLAFDDVRTAADFTAVEATKAGTVVVRRDGRRLTVSGLEPLRATALVTWRRRMAQAAQLKVPARLPRADAAAIRAEHDRRRGALTAEADAAREAARTRAAAVRARAEREDAELATTVAAAAVDAAQRRVALDRRLVTARKAAAEARWHLDEHERRHGPTVVPADLATYVRRVLGLDGSARPGP